VLSLLTCQDGYESLLARELAASGGAGTVAREQGGGWVFAASVPAPTPDNAGDAISSVVNDWCFAHMALLEPAEIRAGSVNALAAAVAENFFATARAERFDAAWPLVVAHASGLDGLGRRASAVETALRELLARKMARVAKLATAPLPRTGNARGLFVFFSHFGRAFVARTAWSGGQRRMADDPAAPSRSYLKVEEAYGVLGREPASNESVVDLGAAPGGWSFSAARRGARVIAIDNGPLKGGALAHPQIEHRREDAFRFRPAAGEVFDWFFCDLVEEPHHVLRTLVERWLAERWCRRFVVNLKFGRADAIALLAETRATLAPHCERLVVRHLFHDREEFTMVGETRA
jgi:23S rRNA (cytidine2498-2'-O)-methyltransferase